MTASSPTATATSGLWLLPVTAAERDFKAANGLEALEERFDDAELEYWDTRRASVV